MVEVLYPFVFMVLNRISLLQEYMNVIYSPLVWYEIRVAFSGRENLLLFVFWLKFSSLTRP